MADEKKAPVKRLIVGIVVDNYKVKQFKERLTARGWLKSTQQGVSGTTLIKASILPWNVEDLTKLCTELQIDFKQSN